MLIQQTQDYSLLKRIKGNRAVNNSHVNRLLEAINATPDSVAYNPIVVNDNFEIIDGQHRAKAIELAQLPIHYIQVKGLNLATAQSLNSVSKPWSPMDYARSYAELGNENYNTYIAFKERFKLNHDILMKYLALDNPITGIAFKRGKFKVFNVRVSEELCNELLEIGSYYPRYNIRSFALGFLQLAQSERYDHSRMLTQMERYGHKFEEQTLPNDYARELERLYNFNRRDNVRLF